MKFLKKVITRVLQLTGSAVTINSQSVTVLERDASGLVKRCQGAFAVTDGGAGFAKGAIHIKTDGGSGTTLYINEGTSSSCDFNALTNVAVPDDGSVTTAKLDDEAVTNPKVADSAGASGLFVKKSALVVYDFAVDGGDVGAVALTGAPTIPDNAVVKLASYDVITTVTTAGADAGTLKLGFATDGDLTTALAVSDALNAWDAGARDPYATALQVGLAPVTKKLTGARVPVLTVGGEAVTAGKIVFELEYWISA